MRPDLPSFALLAACSLGLLAGCGSVGQSPDTAHATQLALGSSRECAVLTDQTVGCWSMDAFGHEDSPARVPDIDDAVHLSAGYGTFCAVLSSGEVKCWGDGTFGELGDGQAAVGHTSDTPVSVADLSDAVDVRFAPSGHAACAVTQSGKVVCWGLDLGTLGAPSVSCGPYPGQYEGAAPIQQPCAPAPSEVPGVSGAVGVAVGARYQCAIDGSGAAICWGALGAPTGPPVYTPPAPVQGLDHVQQIVLGDAHGCALRADEKVACWGDNSQAQLGLGDDSQVSTASTAAEVPGLEHVTSLAVTSNATCAVLADGTVRCWGAVFEIGTEKNVGYPSGATWSTGRVTSPFLFPVADDAVEVAFRLGGCVRHVDGSVECWLNGDQRFVPESIEE